jgi:hypothetical protein
MDSSTFADLVQLVKQYGPLILVVAFVTWQGWVRECRLNKRIEHLEDGQRGVLMPLVERCADVIAQNTMMMERLEKTMEIQSKCQCRHTRD